MFEKDLNKYVYAELDNIIGKIDGLLDNLDKKIQSRKDKMKSYSNTVNGIEEKIFNKKEEIKNYSKQLAKGLISESIFRELTEETQQQLIIYEEQFKSIKDLMKENPKIKENVLRCKDILKNIVKNKDLNNTELGFFVDKIIVGNTENEDSPVIRIKLNIPQVDSKVLSS